MALISTLRIDPELISADPDGNLAQDDGHELRVNIMSDFGSINQSHPAKTTN